VGIPLREPRGVRHLDGGRGAGAPVAVAPAPEASRPDRHAAALPPAPPARRRVGLGARLAAVDLASSLVGWWAGWAIGKATGPTLSTTPVTTSLWMVAVGVAATISCLAAAGLYRPLVNGIRAGALGRVIQSTAVAAVLVIIWQGLVGDAVPRVALSGVAGALTATVIARCGFDVWLINRRERGDHRTPVVVAGAAGDTAALVEFLELNPEAGFQARAVVGERPRPAGVATDRPPWMGRLDDVLAAVERTGASDVLLAVSRLPAPTVDRVVHDLASAGVTVHLSTGVRGVSRDRLQTFALAHEPIVRVTPPSHPAVQRVAKRALDILVASVLLAVTAPAIVAAAVLIKAHDRGPVFFRQVRVGRDGRPFTLLKLRTMQVEAEVRLADLRAHNERHGPLFKVSDDPRVTPIGALLRSTAVDELPQVVNVLTGRMSIVGPRPALPSETALFDDELQRRHLVRPGVTGLWQVEANHKASFEEYRRLDLFYVDNWSLGVDVAVIVDTVQAIARRVLRTLRRSAPSAPAPVGTPSPPAGAAPEPLGAGR
jgi:exopolysaccharide biosynthesis polyprenyl glycosylphosphotransferase